MKRPKEKVAGPLHVLPLLGGFVVMDQGNGNRILSPRFKKRSAAEKWAERAARIHAVGKLSPARKEEP